MAFYDLTKRQRVDVVQELTAGILNDLRSGKEKNILNYFSDADTYIRKNGYLSIGKIYKMYPDLQQGIFKLLKHLLHSDNAYVRQTTVNAAGEIGIQDFTLVECFFDTALFDPHHSVRNAVIGSVKKMGEKNSGPVLKWATKYLSHPDKEIRREICHGIELRGRTHPQDILPLLKTLQHDKTARVKNTLVHVLGQISYKQGCLEVVISDLKTWENSELVKDAIAEIIDIHNRYRDFAVLTQKQARHYIRLHF